MLKSKNQKIIVYIQGGSINILLINSDIIIILTIVFFREIRFDFRFWSTTLRFWSHSNLIDLSSSLILSKKHTWCFSQDHWGIFFIIYSSLTWRSSFLIEFSKLMHSMQIIPLASPNAVLQFYNLGESSSINIKETKKKDEFRFQKTQLEI